MINTTDTRQQLRAKLNESFYAGIGDYNLPRRERRRIARQLAQIEFHKSSPHTEQAMLDMDAHLLDRLRNQLTNTPKCKEAP